MTCRFTTKGHLDFQIELRFWVKPRGLQSIPQPYFMEFQMKTKLGKRQRKTWSLRSIGFALAIFFASSQMAEAQWTTGTNINNTNTGNVGIGTTATPSQKLDVVGNILLDSSSSWYGINKANGEARAVMFNGALLSDNDYLYFGSLNNGFKFVDANNSPLVTILNNGNVGIGTTGPGMKMNVVGSNGAPASSGSTAVGALRIEGSSNSVLDFGSTGANPFGNWIQSTDKSSLGINYPLLLNPNGGNVGIGTTNPTGGKLDVPTGNVNVGTLSTASATTQPASSAAVRGVSIGFDANPEKGWIQVLRNNTSEIRDLQIQPLGGNVGIGTANPGQKLDVNGVIRSVGNSDLPATLGGAVYITGGYSSPDSGRFIFGDGSGWKMHFSKRSGNVTSDVITFQDNGNITLSGTINAKYQDVAEWVPSSEQLSAGTVVVLDSTKSNQVTSSTVSYDTRVAGVISEQPGIALGEKSDTKVLVATTGRVRVKVDASKGAIHIGDLLVTSDVPGVAMKSEPVSLGGVQLHRPGTLIGKALDPLEKGTGTILVLLSLQ
jgi:hypothetical protein